MSDGQLCVQAGRDPNLLNTTTTVTATAFINSTLGMK